MIVENGREVLIRVRGLAKSFGTQQIWDGLSLDVFRGEILAIVGGSGQGKSVLATQLVERFGDIEERGNLFIGAHVFFNFGDQERGDVHRVIATLAFRLAASASIFLLLPSGHCASCRPRASRPSSSCRSWSPCRSA